MPYLMLEPGLQPLIVYSKVLQDLFSLGTGDGLLLKSQYHSLLHLASCCIVCDFFFSYLVKDIIHSDYITLYYLTYLNVNVPLSFTAPIGHREGFNEDM